VSPANASLVAVLSDLAAIGRKLVETSESALALLERGEAQCDVPGPEPVAPPIMTPLTSTETSPVTTADLPLLMTRAEVAQFLRIHERTVGRLRADPGMQFPEPVHLGTALRWKRSSIMRWIGSRAR
jgi:predicted DNA-binding transcriptional regulator AlpA